MGRTESAQTHTVRLFDVRHRAVARAGAIATVVIGAVLLGGCSGDRESGSATPGTTSTTSTRPTSTTAAPGTSPTTGASASTATTGGSPAEDLSGFQTAPVRLQQPVAVPPVPRVVAVRAAHHDGFDRVVFDFDGPLPGAVAVQSVDRVVADGSGEPVAVAGRAFLQVRFEGAQAHDDQGRPTIAARTDPGLPSIEEVVVAGDFEGYVTVALGLGAPAPFRVLELSAPTRVVVDVRTA